MTTSQTSLIVSCEGTCPTVPSPHSPSQTGVNALMVGKGQGEGWRQIAAPKVCEPPKRFGLADPIWDRKQLPCCVVPLSLSRPHKGGGNVAALLVTTAALRLRVCPAQSALSSEET